MSKTTDILKQKRWKKGRLQPFYKLVCTSYNVFRFVAVPAYRSRVVNTFRFKENYHQFSNFTQINRYPSLFTFAQSYFREHPNPKILSFGCSTGEEIATLADYIPQATFVGVDINTWCIKQANKKHSSPNRFFYHSLAKSFEEAQDFDAVFCMAVFQNPENRHDKERTVSAYPFEQFEKQLIALDKKIKAGGLLFIDHCDFNFLETSLRTSYQIVSFKENQQRRERPIFNRKNQKIADAHYSFRVFQKKGELLS